ncbi:MAG: hypothetical protein JWM80_1334 [Cyanobacteria bacterium RYN_339]|nr:hypothetical protein [Cyanobacteria bacterium RYN_339]
MQKSIAVLSTLLLLAGCGSVGAPATVTRTQASNVDAKGFFIRLPKDRALTNAENELEFDGFRKLATAEATKFHKAARLQQAFCLNLTEKGLRAIDANLHFYFDVPGSIMRLHVAVKGTALSFSQVPLEGLIKGLQPMAEPKLGMVAAIDAARSLARVDAPFLSVKLSQPRNFTHPIYEVMDETHAKDFFLPFEVYCQIDAMTGQALVGKVDPAAVQEMQAADR